MLKQKLYAIPFANIYPLYVKKAEAKGRTKEEVDEIIFWLTGHDKKCLKAVLDKKVGLEEFYKKAPKLNPNVKLITGVVCGVRIEEIDDPVMKKIRYLDKLIDELAKGKAMGKILRSK